MSGAGWRDSADGILWAVHKGGAIKLETLENLLALIVEKTAYPHHVTVEIQTGAVLKTIDNEDDAKETIRRLLSLPSPIAPHQIATEIETPAQPKRRAARGAKP